MSTQTPDLATDARVLPLARTTAPRNRRRRTLWNARVELWEAQGRACAYCRRELALEVTTLDHLVPKGQGGPLGRWNLLVSCELCNKRRGCQPLREWLRAEGITELRHPLTGGRLVSAS